MEAAADERELGTSYVVESQVTAVSRPRATEGFEDIVADEDLAEQGLRHIEKPLLWQAAAGADKMTATSDVPP